MVTEGRRGDEGGDGGATMEVGFGVVAVVDGSRGGGVIVGDVSGVVEMELKVVAVVTRWKRGLFLRWRRGWFRCGCGGGRMLAGKREAPETRWKKREDMEGG
ncbi:hypothetical protein Tco_1304153 [Tanacetum coccineum]